MACIGVVGVSGQALIVDATPDFPAQLAALGAAAGRGGPHLDRIVLTHAHIGHYLGLAYLGREVLSTDGVPVHATSRMMGFLRDNKPWSHLVKRREIELHALSPGSPLDFDGLRIHAFLAPHRAEDTDTIGLEIAGPDRTLIYLPDTDVLDKRLIERIEAADVSLVDGTFYSREELRHREMLEVRHPCVTEALPLLQGAKGKVVFTHLNHTNALLRPTDAPSLPDGFRIAEEGESFAL